MNRKIECRDIASLIDHAVLHPAATDQTLIEGLALATGLRVKGICVKPYAVPLIKTHIAEADIEICAVIAFPHGNSAILTKVHEAELAMTDGATEIDMVVNIGKVLGGDFGYVSDEVCAVNDAVAERGGALKVIFETGYLEESHIIALCRICTAHRVAFAKTSSGFGFVKRADGAFSQSGAEERHVALMRRHLTNGVQIKASGGISTLDAVLRFRALGAARIGTSATKAILEEAKRAFGTPS